MLMKKGNITLMIVGIILVIASLLVLAPKLVNFLSSGQEKGPEILCQETVALRAASALSVSGVNVAKTPLLCKTIDKDISGTKDDVMHQLGDLMARCWWMYGEGRYDDIAGGGSFGYEDIIPDFSTSNACVMCYSVVVEDSEEFSVSDSISSEEFANFLLTEDYKHRNSKGNTYLGYVQTVGGPGAIQVLTDIESEKAYGISFAAKNKEPGFLASVGLGAVGLGVLSIASGPVGWVTGGILAIGGTLSTIDDVMTLFRNREVSSIYINDLATAQENCFQGDLGGN
ncbi:MAG: hypothetical protein CMH61_01725 [Nanoarchaeota archaeon]|nr:hypothetical protein [Nanoarchaeota archaeon]